MPQTHTQNPPTATPTVSVAHSRLEYLACCCCLDDTYLVTQRIWSREWAQVAHALHACWILDADEGDAHNIARVPVPQIASGIKGFPLYSALVYEILILPTLQSGVLAGFHLNNLLYLFWLWHKAFPFVFRLPWLPQTPARGHSTEENTQTTSQHKCFRVIQKKNKTVGIKKTK